MRSEIDRDAPAARGSASQVRTDGFGESDLQDRLSSLAHELNNPLAAIMGFTQLLLKKQWPPDDRTALETINGEAMRAAAIVHDLLALARTRGTGEHASRALDILLVGRPSKTMSEVEGLLAARGHTVLSAASMDVALRFARNTPFDVVLSDDSAAGSMASVARALRGTVGCANARFVDSIPRLSMADSAGGDESTSKAPQVDGEALRRLVEGD